MFNIVKKSIPYIAGFVTIIATCTTLYWQIETRISKLIIDNSDRVTMELTRQTQAIIKMQVLDLEIRRRVLQLEIDTYLTPLQAPERLRMLLDTLNEQIEDWEEL